MRLWILLPGGFQPVRKNNGDKSVLNPIEETVACVNQRTLILAGRLRRKASRRRLGSRDATLLSSEEV